MDIKVTEHIAKLPTDQLDRLSDACIDLVDATIYADNIAYQMVKRKLHTEKPTRPKSYIRYINDSIFTGNALDDLVKISSPQLPGISVCLESRQTAETIQLNTCDEIELTIKFMHPVWFADIILCITNIVTPQFSGAVSWYYFDDGFKLLCTTSESSTLTYNAWGRFDVCQLKLSSTSHPLRYTADNEQRHTLWKIALKSLYVHAILANIKFTLF